MSNQMTDYNKRLDEVLCRFAVDTHESKPGQDEAPNFDRAKQAITSLIKELVAEAKPVEYVHPYDTDPLKGGRQIGYDEAIREFKQSLLKALEEV